MLEKLNNQESKLNEIKEYHLSVLNQINTGYLRVKVVKTGTKEDYCIIESNDLLGTLFSFYGKINGRYLKDIFPDLQSLLERLEVTKALVHNSSLEECISFPSISKRLKIKLFSLKDAHLSILINDITEVTLYEEKLKEQTEEIQAQNEELLVTNEQLSDSFDNIYETNVKLTQKEKELKSANKMLQLVLDHIPVRVFWKDINSQYLGCNKNFAYDAGKSSSIEVIGKFDTDLFSNGFAKLYQTDDKTVIKSGIPKLKYEEPQDSLDGGIRWLRTNKVPLMDDSNKVFGVLGTYEDITNFKDIQKELIFAKEKAEESDRLKSAFLANMSHEIRTPMNGILGFSELLNEELDENERIRYTKIINDSSKQLLGIVNDIIDISKIESGQVELHKSEFNLSDLLLNVIGLHETEANEKGIKLILDNCINQQNFSITQDSTKLFQIISNLISNAIKFTEEGKVTLKTSLKENNLIISVIDTGMGIPEYLHESIFDRFNQGNANELNKIKGTGLGLSISKGLLELMGGRIQVKSVPNQGATFLIKLPILVTK